MSSAPPFVVRLRFHGDLTFFLRRDSAGIEITRKLNEPTSVKDVIESCGVPHPEVNRVLVEDSAVDFSYLLQNNNVVDVYPVGSDAIDPVRLPALQNLTAERFVADGHLGKLTRNLRLLGIDVAYDPKFDDRQLLQIMQQEERALLTRDRPLLMHSIVRDGYCPRSDDPLDQTIEVVRRFGLLGRTQPFSRCLQCNAHLRAVDKSAVVEQLEPLTRIYYDEFRSCTGCGKIFWRGSHFGKLESLLERVRGALGAGCPPGL